MDVLLCREGKRVVYLGTSGNSALLGSVHATKSHIGGEWVPKLSAFVWFSGTQRLSFSHCTEYVGQFPGYP